MEGEIKIRSGAGLLDMRAIYASIVGPGRLAMTQRNMVAMRNDESVQIAKNLGAADAYVFVGVALPQNSATNPLLVLFSKDEVLGFSTALPARLTDQVNHSFSFMQLLLPGEQLYGQIVSGGPVTQHVVVASVVF